jgi:mannose/fructose/N-acetylgalactosamine-specific phosphotransferase system component IID
MLGVDSPVLHCSVPAAVVDKTDDPQSLTTVTTGAAGVVLGAAVPLPGALVQPLTVVVTVYVPALLTVMLGVDAPVLHCSVPAAVVDKTDDSQLLTTFTAGASGIGLALMVALVASDIHPRVFLTVTKYVPIAMSVKVIELE